MPRHSPEIIKQMQEDIRIHKLKLKRKTLLCQLMDYPLKSPKYNKLMSDIVKTKRQLFNATGNPIYR